MIPRAEAVGGDEVTRIQHPLEVEPYRIRRPRVDTAVAATLVNALPSWEQAR
jgi:hypothetical protein